MYWGDLHQAIFAVHVQLAGASLQSPGTYPKLPRLRQNVHAVKHAGMLTVRGFLSSFQNLPTRLGRCGVVAVKLMIDGEVGKAGKCVWIRPSKNLLTSFK
jgi:hypothetical protein